MTTSDTTDDKARAAWQALEQALREGRQAEVVIGLLHALARLYQFVEATSDTPGLGIVLLDQELAIRGGPTDMPGTRATLEVLRATLASSARKPN